MFRISLRAKSIVLALMLVLFGVQPILESDSGGGSPHERAPLDGEVALACHDSADADRDADEVAAYLEDRPDEIDALLPDARGATRFVGSPGTELEFAL